MNKYTVILILVCLTWIPYTTSLLQQNLKTNLYHKVNVKIQNAINKIFNLLKLNKNFTTDKKHRLLLSMHATMKTLAEKNYPHYKDIRRASKLYFKSKPNAGLFNLDKLINILVKEKLTPDNLSFVIDHANKTEINLQLTSFELPENEETSFAFLKEYLNNANDGYSFDSPLQKIRNEFEKNSRRVKENRRLKAWKASKLINLSNYRRVYHGKSATIRRFPFLASIHESGRFVCAGSIISKLMVITAATCVHTAYFNKPERQNIDEITVRVGSDETDGGGQICNVSQVFFHHDYDPDTLRNNLAILQIQTALKFVHSKMKIRRIDFQRMEGELHRSTENILIVGWGGTNNDHSTGEEPLLYTHLEVLSSQKCIDFYTRKFVNLKNFCAGFSQHGAGACQRDIGGPGIAGNILVGVISYGPPVCGSQYTPTVFTNIGYYIEWIDSVINGLPQKMHTLSSRVITKRASTHSSMQFRVNNTTTVKEVITTTSQYLEKKENKTVTISTKKEYPKAIQVLTLILNGLLSAGQDLTDLVTGSQNKDDEDTDEGDTGKEAQNKALRHKFGDVSLSNNGQNENSTHTKTENDAVAIYSVMKGLQDYLGLGKAINFSEVYEPVPFDSDNEQHHKNSYISKKQEKIIDVNDQLQNKNKSQATRFQIKKSSDNKDDILETTTMSSGIKIDTVEKFTKIITDISENDDETENESGLDIEPKLESEPNNIKLNTSKTEIILEPNKNLHKIDDNTRKVHANLEYKKDDIIELVQQNLSDVKRKVEKYKHKILRIKTDKKYNNSIYLQTTKPSQSNEDFSGFKTTSSLKIQGVSIGLIKKNLTPTFRSSDNQKQSIPLSMEGIGEILSIERTDLNGKYSNEINSNEATIEIAIDSPVNNTLLAANQIKINLSLDGLNAVRRNEISQDDNNEEDILNILDNENVLQTLNSLDKDTSQRPNIDLDNMNLLASNEKEENCVSDEIITTGRAGDDIIEGYSYNNADDDMVNENGRRFLDYINIK